ncbi:MAG: vitamin B12-dependent ribonucleotide reductase [Phycisphaerales bacterium]|nr:MAG: vitamin B12-dependent ribonucleotide reductase [Phycisphaerales bacterium]
MTPNAVRVLQARYLKKDEAGQCVEEPRDLFRRVAAAVADAEMLHDDDAANRSEWENRFYDLMASCRFMPNSPTLMNAGRDMGMLSACFVLPVGDSIDEIFDSIKHTALIQKAGGGTGFAFDRLRPTGDYIRSSGGTTSGPISFWRAFSEATNAIQQGAFRRGANMGMMYIHHPDILKFLHAKQDVTQFTNYNISVKVTDEWMEAFRRDPDGVHLVKNPRTSETYCIPRDVDVMTYPIQSLVPAPHAQTDSGEFYTRRDIWDILIRNAWQTGEPGVVFIDRINEHNPTPHVGRIEATNPCGEQPLLDYEACNLGSVNVGRFITNPGTPEADVDWDALGNTVDECVRFLDNVIDINRYPLKQIDAACKANRKIGLGVMGFADALYMLGAGYNTDAGIDWGRRLMQFINERAHTYSSALAQSRGNFPNWQGSTWDTVHHRPMRNACCTTVAPTGTISIIAGCSCGIEPLFALVFKRNVLREQGRKVAPMTEVNPIFERVMREQGRYAEDLMERIARDGSIAQMDELPEPTRRVFTTAHDITPEWHVRMQAAFQEHCDAAISKTINFPTDATPQSVDTIYQMSYDLRCKGVTVYRDGCREAQPMCLEETQGHGQDDGQDAPTPVSEQAHRVPKDLPEVTSSLRLRQMTPFGNMHVHITVDPGTQRELEVFAQLGKGGDLACSDLEAICRMVSLWLRSGGRLQDVIQQLEGIGSSLQVSTKDGRIMSLPDGLARSLIKYSWAKSRFGLQDLLLGNYSIDDLGGALRGEALMPNTSKGGNGHGKGKGNGDGSGDGGGDGNGDGNGKGNGSKTGSARRGEAGLATTAAPLLGRRLNQEELFKTVCPVCGDKIRHAEGCQGCESCGWARC